MEKHPKGLLPLPSARLGNMQTMIKQLMVCSVERTSYYRDWVALKARIGFPANYDALPPRGHIRVLALCRAEPDVLDGFLRLGSNVPAIRSVAGSLRRVSSGINS